MSTASAPSDRSPDAPLPDGLVASDEAARPVHLVAPGGLDRFLAARPWAEREWLAGVAFAARRGEIALLPGPGGVAGCVLGLGEGGDRLVAGGLADRLPGGAWAIDPESLERERRRPGGLSADDAVLGFALGAYRFRRDRATDAARLAVPDGAGRGVDLARAMIGARDLINTPANRLGPSELADAAASLAARFGASFERIEGEALATGYPAIHAVGRGSERAPVVARLAWRSARAGAGARLVSLCGKGVCFDTGGYDLKPSAAMLRMKKDMGGAAVLLAVTELVMRADLPVRLELRLGCVENSVSGAAMRPSDVIATRSGLSVEVNNTDAEGRLVLADLLADAGAASPDVLIDAATLTGAARVALGPDLPALFTDDEAMAAGLLAAGAESGDPMWRLPIWTGYEDWLETASADLANISSRNGAGATIAALFLRRFVPAGVRWAHVDVYCWNDRSRPGRPEGGEAHAVRAIYGFLTKSCDIET